MPPDFVPRVLAVVGRSGSGKTTLIEALISRFAARGLRVSTLKHTHHEVDLDRPGKDSWRHRQAGAQEVLLVGDSRWALLHECRETGPVDLHVLLGRLAPVDLVLVEGFGSVAPGALGPRLACLEVHRGAISLRPGKTPFWPADPAIEAVASDMQRPGGGGAAPLWFDLDDVQSICAWIVSRLHLADHFS